MTKAVVLVYAFLSTIHSGGPQEVEVKGIFYETVAECEAMGEMLEQAADKRVAFTYECWRLQ